MGKSCGKARRSGLEAHSPSGARGPPHDPQDPSTHASPKVQRREQPHPKTRQASPSRQEGSRQPPPQRQARATNGQEAPADKPRQPTARRPSDARAECQRRSSAATARQNAAREQPPRGQPPQPRDMPGARGEETASTTNRKVGEQGRGQPQEPKRQATTGNGYPGGRRRGPKDVRHSETEDSAERSTTARRPPRQARGQSAQRVTPPRPAGYPAAKPLRAVAQRRHDEAIKSPIWAEPWLGFTINEARRHARQHTKQAMRSVSKS